MNETALVHIRALMAAYDRRTPDWRYLERNRQDGQPFCFSLYQWQQEQRWADTYNLELPAHHAPKEST